VTPSTITERNKVLVFVLKKKRMRKTPASAKAYACISGKCAHDKGSTECWTFKLANALASIGDPSILDDTEFLSAFFTIPMNPKLDLSSFRSPHGKILDPALVLDGLSLFVVQTAEPPDMDVYRAVVLLVYAAMGVSLGDDRTRGALLQAEGDVEYGNEYTSGGASDARIEWLKCCGPADKGKSASRARAVLSIIVSMITRGMEMWAIELFTMLSEEHAAMRAVSSIQDKDEARALLSETSKGAPMFSKCVGLLRPYIERLVQSNDRHGKKQPSSAWKPSSEQPDEDCCDCGLSWLRIAEYKGSSDGEGEKTATKMYMLCPIDVILSKGGCGKFLESKFD
jgi:hypothetical protein